MGHFANVPTGDFRLGQVSREFLEKIGVGDKIPRAHSVEFVIDSGDDWAMALWHTLRRVRVYVSVVAIRAAISSTETGQEKSPEAMNVVLGGQVAPDAEKGSTAFFSNPVDNTGYTGMMHRHLVETARRSIDTLGIKSGVQETPDPVSRMLVDIFAELRAHPVLFEALAAELGYPQNRGIKS